MTRPPAALDTTTFYLSGRRVRVDLVAVQALQTRDDLSGKFAKKLGRQRRALAAVGEEINKEFNELLPIYGEKDDHGQLVPALKLVDGKPVKRRDRHGNETDAFETVRNEYRLADEKGYEEAKKEILERVFVVTCPAFTVKDGVPELERFKAVRGDIIDALQDLEEDSELTTPPLALVPDAPTEAPIDGKSGTEDRAAP